MAAATANFWGFLLLLHHHPRLTLLLLLLLLLPPILSAAATVSRKDHCRSHEPLARGEVQSSIAICRGFLCDGPFPSFPLLQLTCLFFLQRPEGVPKSSSRMTQAKIMNSCTSKTIYNSQCVAAHWIALFERMTGKGEGGGEVYESTIRFNLEARPRTRNRMASNVKRI